MPPEKILYTGTATSTGGREGRASTSDGRLDLALSTPRANWAARVATAPTRSSCSPQAIRPVSSVR